MGAAKVAHGLAESFGGIGTALSGLVAKSAAAGMGLGALAAAVGPIAHLAHGISELGVSGQQLTTEFEATAQAHSVSTRRMIAQTGIFGKELDKLNGQAAGMAQGMGFSDQTASHAVATFSQFKDEMKALGIESAITAGKVEEGLGVSVRDVAFQMHRMKDGLKLSQKDMEELGKSFASTGEAIHDVATPFKSMDAVLDLAERRTLLVKQGMSSIGGKDSVKSINRATKALFVLTGDAKGAAESALELEDKLTSSMENVRSMFSGNSSELDSFLVNTSVVTGDVQKAFQAAAEGPDAFIKSFGGVMAKLKKDGKSADDIAKFFGGQMSEALGPKLANKLLLAVTNADDAKLKLIANAKESGKALADMGKEAWRSTKTLADAFEMAMGAGLAKFRKHGIKEAQQFVADSTKEFDKFNKKMDGLIKEGGPLGKLAQKMSELNSIGAKALLPKTMQPMLAVFSQLSGPVLGAVQAFSQLRTLFGAMLGPMAILLAAVGGFAYLVMKNKKATNSWGDAIRAALGDIEKFLKEGLNKVLNWAKTFDWKGFFKTLAGGVVSGIKTLIKTFSSASDGLTSALLGTDSGGSQGEVSALATTIFGALRDAFAAVDWGALLEDIGNAMLKHVANLGKILTGLVNKAVAYFKDIDWSALLTSLGKTLESFGPYFRVALTKVVPVVLEGLDNLGTALRDGLFALFRALPDIAKGLMNFLSSALGFLADVIIGIWDGIKEYLVSKFPESADKIIAVFDTVKEFFLKAVDTQRKALETLGDAFKWLGDKVIALWDHLFGHSVVPDLFQRGIDTMTAALNSLWEFFEKIGGKIVDMFSGVMSKVRGLFGSGDKGANAAIAADMDASLGTVKDATNRMKDYVQKILFDGVVEAITSAFVTAFRTITDGSAKFFRVQAKSFQDFANGVVTVFRQMWSLVLEDTEKSTDAAADAISSSLKNLQQLRTALEQIRAAQEATDKANRGEDGKIKRVQTDAQKLLLETVDNPRWYEDDFKGRFAQGIADMVNALSNIKGAVSPAAGGPGIGAQRQNLTNRPNISFAPAQAGVGPYESGGR